MKKLLSTLLMGLIFSLPAFSNLIPNPEFASKDGQAPDGWKSWQKNKYPKAFRTVDGTVSISEKSPSYSNIICCRIPVDGFKSYDFSIEYKNGPLLKTGGIYYYWLDKKGRIISKARFILRTTKATVGWQKLEHVLSSENPVNTAMLQICLANYGQTDNNVEISFRKPCLTIISKDQAIQKTQKQKTIKKKQSTRPETLSTTSLKHNLTWKRAGVPYFVEKGRLGWLDLSTSHRLRQEVTMDISVPENVKTEVYIYQNGGCRKFSPAKVSKVTQNKILTYHIPRHVNWLAWGNGIFFKPGANTPERFEIKVDFKDKNGKSMYKISVPVSQIAAADKVKLPKKIRCRSWYSHPLARNCDSAQQGTLPNALLKDWLDSGFDGGNASVNGAPNWSQFYDLTHKTPFWARDSKTMPQAIGVGGGRTRLLCPSALIKGGADYYVKTLTAGNALKYIKKGSPSITVDYEPYCDGWVTKGCFCKDCLKDFARFANISSSGLTPKTILTKYEDKWVEFRCIQRAKVVKAMVDAIHRLNPEAKFMLCSMPMPGKGEDYRYFKEYGIDLRLYDSFVDIHMPMNYVPNTGYFHRLERDAKCLKKPLMPIIDNGWRTLSGYYPGRAKIQILAAAFMGCKRIYLGQGLMRMDGAWLKMVKQIMSKIAEIEPFIDSSRLGNDTIKVVPGLLAQNNLYSVYRKDKKGNYLLLVVNNSPLNSIFATVKANRLAAPFYSIKSLAGSYLSPDGKRTYFTRQELQKGFPIKLVPFGFHLLKIIPGKQTAASKIFSTNEWAKEENYVREQFIRMTKEQKSNGMSTRMTPDGFTITTPVNSLLVNMRNSAAALWQVNGKPIMTAVAQGCFVAPSMLNIQGLNAKLESCTISKDNTTAVFAVKIKDLTYSGLLIRKTYKVYKNSARIDIQIQVVPEAGYRPFRYRVNNILSIGKDKTNTSYPDKIAYQIPYNTKVIQDRGAKVSIYTRKGAEYPDNKVFFKSYATPEYFSGNWCKATNVITGESVKATFSNADELFLWRRGNVATMEWIYPDAYPDNDPHKVKTWTTAFTLIYSRH